MPFQGSNRFKIVDASFDINRGSHGIKQPSYDYDEEDIQNLPEMVPVCDSVASYIAPKRAKSHGGQYKFVLNAPERKDAIQVIRVSRFQEHKLK